MAINGSLHPRILELLRRFKADIFNPQSAAMSPHPSEHKKASGEYGRVWMKQKGPKVFMWLVGGPAAWGGFMIWAAASDSIASKAALVLATITGVGSIVASIVKDRATMSLEELECFLPALDCQPVESLYCQAFSLVHKSTALDDLQKAEMIKLINELLDLDYNLAEQEQNISLISAESIETQLAKIENEASEEYGEMRSQLQARLDQAKSDQPARQRIASVRTLIETSLIGLVHDLSRSGKLSMASTDPLNQANELLEKIFDQSSSVENAKNELDQFLAGNLEPNSVNEIQTEESPSEAKHQRGTAI